MTEQTPQHDVETRSQSTDDDQEREERRGNSRRDLMEAGGALVAGAAAVGLGAPTAGAQAPPSPVPGPSPAPPAPPSPGAQGSGAGLIEGFLKNNRDYASGGAVPPALAEFPGPYPGKLPIWPKEHFAILTCMDGRLNPETILGFKTGETHVIRNAGGVIDPDAIRALVISYSLLQTKTLILLRHTRCEMLAFQDDVLKAALETSQRSANVLNGAFQAAITPTGQSAVWPQHFLNFRGPTSPVDSSNNYGPNFCPLDDPPAHDMARLTEDLSRGLNIVRKHPWIEGAADLTILGYIYDVDTGSVLGPVNAGPMGEP